MPLLQAELLCMTQGAAARLSEGLSPCRRKQRITEHAATQQNDLQDTGSPQLLFLEQPAQEQPAPGTFKIPRPNLKTGLMGTTGHSHGCQGVCPMCFNVWLPAMQSHFDSIDWGEYHLIGGVRTLTRGLASPTHHTVRSAHGFSRSQTPAKTSG